jgi:hypothetical protein
MEFDFHSFLSQAWWWLFELKQVAWLRVEGVCVGCDCTADKSEIYFCMYIPTGMYDIKIFIPENLNFHVLYHQEIYFPIPFTE